jgi:hypothetical protein
MHVAPAQRRRTLMDRLSSLFASCKQSAKEEINEEVLVSVKVNVSDLEADIPPAGQEK